MPLKSKELTPNVFAKTEIRRLVEEKPLLKDSKEWYLPKKWVIAIEKACAQDNVASIQSLINQDRCLLVHTFSDDAHRGKQPHS